MLVRDVPVSREVCIRARPWCDGTTDVVP